MQLEHVGKRRREGRSGTDDVKEWIYMTRFHMNFVFSMKNRLTYQVVEELSLHILDVLASGDLESCEIFQKSLSSSAT